ncbi:MAG: hypothetical protein A2050_16720 [Candidatus Rokubacteria bacterium GWA2_73_35]|nr:MAG: hypothetical protein A2050_16720 [Candidatus Rokubacteria bacterium GWA2_73_35]
MPPRRLRGLGSFLLVAGGLLVALRVLHVGVPLLFPGTRPGPFAVASLDEAQRRLGFAPLVPAYRPATLGVGRPSLTVTLGPYPTFLAVWRGEHSLSLTQRRGGPRPAAPPTSQALAGVADSLWWRDGPTNHLLLRRGEFWVTVETDLPVRDLRRIADTLGPWSARGPGPAHARLRVPPPG